MAKDPCTTIFWGASHYWRHYIDDHRDRLLHQAGSAPSYRRSGQYHRIGTGSRISMPRTGLGAAGTIAKVPDISIITDGYIVKTDYSTPLLSNNKRRRAADGTGESGVAAYPVRVVTQESKIMEDTIDLVATVLQQYYVGVITSGRALVKPAIGLQTGGGARHPAEPEGVDFCRAALHIPDPHFVDQAIPMEVGAYTQYG